MKKPAGIVTPDGRHRRVEVGEVEVLLLHDAGLAAALDREGAEAQLSTGLASMLHCWEEDDATGDLTHRPQKGVLLVFGPQGTTLPEMVRAIGAAGHRRF